MATAALIRGGSPPCFTIGIASPKLDETGKAMLTARSIGAKLTPVACDASGYPGYLSGPGGGSQLSGHRHILRGPMASLARSA